MSKGDGLRMETVPGHVLDGKRAIEAVIYDVHPRKGELGANLMRDACAYCHFQQRAFLVLDHHLRTRSELRQGVQWLELRALGARKPVVAEVDHPTEGERRIVDEIVFKRAADGNGTFDQRKVGLPDGLCGELPAEVREGFCRAGDKDEARRIGIDSVKRTRHQRVFPKSRQVWPESAAFGIAHRNGVHQRSGLTTGQRLDGHPRRLVKRQKCRVLKQGLGTGSVGRDKIVAGFEQFDDMERLAALQLQAFGRPSPVDEDHPAPNGVPDERARCGGEGMKKGGIQSDAAFVECQVLISNHFSTKPLLHAHALIRSGPSRKAR